MTDKAKETMQPDDELTRRIALRLAERRYKLEKMQNWERPSRKFHMIGASLALVAACIAALLIIAPWRNVPMVDRLGMQQPNMTTFRSASVDIAKISEMMERQDYDAALIRTEKALRRSDTELKELYCVLEIWYDDEFKYEEEQEKVMNSELRWMYIYLLVKAERKKDAIRELKKYIKSSEYAAHMNEARRLLKEIKKI